ncbi:MAG: response regulator [Sandaracinaceae bacterium]|jgi:CheY-like chemotaxis protein|nr:MAG: response regulator [Sandaracinaceae bacterium]HBQ10321.1 hypothetical protein [Myxococcales bacterium]
MTARVILTVDDDKTVLDSLKSQLKAMFGTRFQYEMAESAHEAWEVIEELHRERVKILVVVSDWLMPDVKGDEFLARVHQLDEDIVCVMLTGYADQRAVERVKAAGIVHRLLQKPWSPEDLREAIDTAL